uniref:PWD n=1 Tax=Arundo donax TaxID=35708 RepID=A0A0A9EMP0_ARUDO
MPTCSPNLTW